VIEVMLELYWIILFSFLWSNWIKIFKYEICAI